MAIEDVKTTDSLEQGRVKWNANDTELHSRLTTTENTAPSYSSSFSGSKTTTSDGWVFNLSTQLGPGFEVNPGSVRLSVNGIVYTSHSDQTESDNSDYYIHSNLESIVFKNVANGGTLDLIDDDVVVITFRRRNETQQQQGN